MSFMLPQMRSAYEGQQVAPSRGWFSGPEAATPSEIAARTTLRARILQPTFMSVNRYRARLERQAWGAPVAAINDIPILLAHGENDCEEDNEFIR